MGCKMGSLLKKNKEEMAAPRPGMENQQHSAIELEQDNRSSRARRNEVIPAVNNPIICNPEEEFPDLDEGNPNPSEWVRSCNEYFQMHQIPENLKMDYVVLNLEGKIFHWFERYMWDHGYMVSWDEFSDDICRRFSLPRTTVEEEEEEEEFKLCKQEQVHGVEDMGIKEIEEEEEEGDKCSETAEEISLDEKLEGMGINTLKLLGKVNQKPIVILIDTGSTHSFLSPKFVQDMGLQCARTSTLQVSVASGAELICNRVCPNFKWAVQEEPFEKDIMVLELNGCMCDMVLGMDWVDEFAPVQLNTKPLSISFYKGSRWITLDGILPDSVLKKLS